MRLSYCILLPTNNDSCGATIVVTSISQISRILSYSAFQVDYVVIRKLRTPLITQAARNDLLQRFVKQVVSIYCYWNTEFAGSNRVWLLLQVEGMPYALTFQKIFNSRRTQLPPEDYFCSELVNHVLWFVFNSHNLSDLRRCR